MALKTFHSSTITFLDRTDERILETYIQSNHPTAQIKNANTGEYTPDWSIVHLVLEADVFVNSTEITNDAQTVINWYKKIDGIETLIGTGRSVTISSNVLETIPVITYVCRAEYQKLKAVAQTTYTRADTGADGSDASAPIILAQYSADGVSGWTTSLNTSIHKYLRLSYDSGATWTTSIKIVGEDGKSVSLEGTAYYNGILLKSDIGRAITLYRDETWMETSKITVANNGDSYIAQGYLCVYNSTIESFVCTALIQGEKGVDGESSYLYIRYATDSSGTNMSSNPAGMTYIGSVVTNSSQAPTIPQAYAWRKFVGEDAKSIVLSGSAQVFKVNTEGEVYPSTISVTAQAINTSVRFWTYSINGGVSFTSTIPAGVTVNGTVVTINGKLMDKETLVFRADDNNGHSDIFTVYKAYDGTNGTDGAPGETSSIAFLTNENVSFAANAKGEAYGTVITTNVVAYEGTKKVRPTLGTIVTSGLPTGMTIAVDQETSALTDSEVVLLLTVANGSTLGPASSTSGTITIPIIYPVSTNLKLSWSKINTGATGAGISSVTVDYGVSSSSAVQPASWQSSIPNVPEGQYLWTRTVTDYTDPEIVDTVTYIYAKQGTKGDTGTAGSSVTVSSVQYQEGTSATVSPTGTWSNTVVTVAEGKYLWTKTTFSDGKIAYGVAKQGVSGKDGVGINSTTVDYGVSDSATVQPTTWQQSIPVVSEGKYLWTRTVIDYTDTSRADTVTYTYAKQGTKGDTGVAGSSVTVSTIQYQEGSSATTAPTGTWSPAVVAVANGKYLWTKTTFSDGKVAYGVAKQGEKGDKGDKGDQGVQGPKGNDGQQLYTWIKYADTPTSGMSNDPTGKTYIGLAYNKTTATESNAYSDYMWSLIKGETGPIGPKGDDGQQYYTWIKYADNASGANMSNSPTGKLYIGLAYNKTTSTESSVASDYTWALFKGDKGDKGNDAYTVLLTNESHVFAGSISTAIASSATTQVLAYNGAASQSVTIISVNGVAASTASTATGIAGLSFKCSALSGASPTITFTCTTAFVSPNGTIPIVIKVGSISITKMFTYSIAFKGATGGVGAPSSSYWLVANADAVQKTTSGDILCTPATVTFTGKIQTGTSAPTDYAGRWIIAYTTDGTTYTNLYTSTANEVSTSVATGITYKALRARMYLAGGTATLLDEQIIPFVSDGAIGVPGNDAVTFQVYSSNGYALSTNTPTVTLQTFAYIGDVAITSGATYQWYSYNNGWSAISGATLSYLDVSRTDVSFSKSYMCKMIFGGVEYTGVATIDDKNDTNKVFTSKPSAYTVGDLWIVGMDYIPSGVEVGTLLRTEHTNLAYADSDWIAATKYDEKIDALNSSVGKYDKYFSFDSQNGLKISARDANGNASQFSTTLSNERLSFNQGTDAVAYIESNKMKIKEAEIISPLTVTGQYSGSTMLQAPIINIGNFSIVVESNGSLSIIANT